MPDTGRTVTHTLTFFLRNWRPVILVGNGYKCPSITGGTVREISHIRVKPSVPTPCFAQGTIMP